MMNTKLPRRPLLLITSFILYFGSVSTPVLAETVKPAQLSNPVIVINKGIGGNNTEAALKRFERDVLAFHPQHLVIYFGINDAVNPGALVPVPQYRKNLTAMIERARTAGTRHIILLTPHAIIESLVLQRHKKESYPFPESLNDHLLQYDTAVREIAQAYNVNLVDLRSVVNRHGGTEITRDSIIRNPGNGGSNDGIHLTAAGYRLMAQAVAEKFKSNIGPGQTVVCFGDSLTFGPAVKGSGTSLGETFPAFLNDLLNVMAGVEANARAFPAPREKMPDGNLLANGDFEDTTDGQTPHRWLLWQVPNQYEGTLGWRTDEALAGSHSITVTATNEKLPAYLTGPHLKLQDKTPLSFTFRVRGRGEVLLLVNQYSGTGGNQSIPPDEEAQRQQKWVAVTDQWQTRSATYRPQADATWISAAFLVHGSISLDDVTIKIVAEDSTTPPPPTVAAPATN